VRFARVEHPTDKEQRLVVLTAGYQPQRKDETAEAAALSVVIPREGDDPLVRKYPLPIDFDRVVCSDDGELALLHFANVAADDSSQVFVNPNQLGLLDLTADPNDDALVLRSIRSFGSAPLDAMISPPMRIAEQQQRRLAVVLSQDYVTLMDMDHPSRREITVRLTAEGAAAEVKPIQVAFAPAQGTIVVRAEGAEDVFSLVLHERSDAEDDENDFRPVITQPSAGKVAEDLLLLPGQQQTTVLTANDGQELALIDVDTGNFSSVTVPGSVDTLLGVPKDDPQYALAFSRERPQRQVFVVDLAKLRSGSRNAVVTRATSRTVHDMVLAPNSRRALLVHDDERTVLSVLDLDDPNLTDTPIRGQLPLESFDFVGSTQLVGVSSGLSQLGLLYLDNLQPASLRLDYPPQKVFAVGQYVAVAHASTAGLVTMVPAANPDRAHARVLWGFLLDQLIDRPIED